MATTYPSSYSTQLQHKLGSTASFGAILRYSVDCFRATGSISDFRSLRNGTALIQTDGQATAYLAAYGAMHQQKLNSAYGQLSSLNAWPVGRAEVIDWGCGQGVASGVLLDYQRHQLPGLIIDRLTLIEPSAVALNRAVDHMQVLTNASVRPFHSEAEEVSPLTLTTDPNKVKIHLFSNLLDMETVDYRTIASIIRSSQSGRNLFVCVSPCIYPGRDARLGAFRDAFANARTLSVRTNNLSGEIYNLYQQTYQPRVVRRNECLFSVQL